MKKKILVLALMTLSLNAFAASGGGNGPGNGTGEVANELALKALLSTNDGLSVEEKIYDLWIKAENSVPANLTRTQLWVGLSVVNMGEIRYWDRGNVGLGKLHKYQKFLLSLEQVPAVKIGDIVVQASKTYGTGTPIGNFDGDLDPRNTYMGPIDINSFLPYSYENRPDLGGQQDERYLKKVAKFLSSGLLVKSLHRDQEENPPTEYRQINENMLVGLTKVTETSAGPRCRHSLEEYRYETKSYEVEDSFLGIPYKRMQEYQAKVIDKYKNAPDYGIPGVCNVQLLIKSTVK